MALVWIFWLLRLAAAKAAEFRDCQFTKFTTKPAFESNRVKPQTLILFFGSLLFAFQVLEFGF